MNVNQRETALEMSTQLSLLHLVSATGTTSPMNAAYPCLEAMKLKELVDRLQVPVAVRKRA
jgi:hypothetical protein